LTFDFQLRPYQNDRDDHDHDNNDEDENRIKSMIPTRH